MTRLSFIEGNHTYWLDNPDTGKSDRIPSVSGLTGLVYPFAGERYFLGLAADAAAEAWDDVDALPATDRRLRIYNLALGRSDRPRAFGTAVHHYCEQLWTGDPVDVPDDYAGHVRSVADWWNTEQVSLVVAEKMCWTDADPDLGLSAYAGRFDLIVKHPERGVGLLDLKTWMPGSSGTPRPKEWAFQLAGYAAMTHLVDGEQDVPMPPIDWCGVLHVGPSGAVLHTLPGWARRRAEAQIEAVRMLKALPNPTMETAQ